MVRIEDYFSHENATVAEIYQSTWDNIAALQSDLQKRCVDTKKEQPFFALLFEISQKILRVMKLEKDLREPNCPPFWQISSFADLKMSNDLHFQELLPENYGTSFLNPAYAVSKLGDGFGQLFSHFYSCYFNHHLHAYQHERFLLEQLNQGFIKVCEAIIKYGLDYEKLREATVWSLRHSAALHKAAELKRNYDPEFSYFTDIVLEADLDDLRYLFRTGHYVSEYSIRLAQFMNSYPESKLRTLGKLMADAYVRGFATAGKDLSKKNTVKVAYQLGQERLMRLVAHELKMHSLAPIFSLMPDRANKQYDHDHKFDLSLFLDNDYVTQRIQVVEDAYKRVQNLANGYSGPIYSELFGEAPFKPENKSENLSFSEEQNQLFQELRSRIVSISERYEPSNETSFSIIAFPSPEIGEKFEEIFADILEVNSLDPIKYHIIQKEIIDVLDTAEHVHIKGKDTNKTDLIVKLQSLADSHTQTLFENCGADLNIPVGEVFTSPQLNGTTGTLHVDKNYLDGLRYENLVLGFTDGYVTSYSCTNYKTDEENRKFIEKNLLFPHKTLPMGEFAIGTNTLAYAVCRKHNLMAQLPILILEKMGPHFAIGDTCFSREEDFKTVCPISKKEIIAKDNEHSIRRKEDVSKAYTHCHTDITLAYESIGCISAIRRDGTRIDIIRDGRFVLPGTEDLNEPLDRN